MEENEVNALNARFWLVIAKFYDLPDNFTGTIPEFSERLNFKLTDGFFYSKLLPSLKDNGVLISTGEEKKNYYVGKCGAVYRLNKGNLDKFVVKNNFLALRLYGKWVKHADVDLDIL